MKRADLRSAKFHSWWSAASLRFRPVVANAVVIGVLLILYKIEPFPSLAVPDQVWNTLAFMALAYLAGFASYALVWQPAPSKGELVLALFRKLLLRQRTHITGEEKLALFITLLKAYFLPVMTAFLINNAVLLQEHVTILMGFPDWRTVLSVAVFNTAWYPFLFVSFLMVDVAYFTFGYIVDHPRFGNVIRSVDQTFFGWAVTLACYPPFNSAVNTIVSSYASDTAHAYTAPLGAFAFNVVALFLFGVYVWATLALDTKCSNLTNRGIVNNGPYAFVRHPAYASKNAIWILSVLPLGSLAAYMGVLLWAGIYYLRAVTEERHLSQDPDYQRYKSQVPWRFIPRVW